MWVGGVGEIDRERGREGEGGGREGEGEMGTEKGIVRGGAEERGRRTSNSNYFILQGWVEREEGRESMCVRARERVGNGYGGVNK